MAVPVGYWNMAGAALCRVTVTMGPLVPWRATQNWKLPGSRALGTSKLICVGDT